MNPEQENRIIEACRSKSRPGLYVMVAFIFLSGPSGSDTKELLSEFRNMQNKITYLQSQLNLLNDNLKVNNTNKLERN